MDNLQTEHQTQAINPPQTNVLAMVSFIAGILGIFIFGSLIAVICGHIARGQIRESDGRETGDGFAVAGLVMGYLMLALTILVIIGVVFLGIGAALLSST